MLTPIGSTRMQRFLRGAVACLLTANGFAVVVLAADDAAGPLPAEQGTRTVTLIQGTDGTTTEVDPATPAGKAAIEQARRAGATITETTVPAEQAAQETTPSTLAQETTPTSGLLPTLPTLPLNPEEVVDDAQDLVDDTLDKVQETVPTPLDPTIDQAQDTVKDTVDKVQETITTVLKPVVTTPTTTAPAPVVTTPTLKPVTSVVQNTVTTVSGTVGGLTTGLGGL